MIKELSESKSDIDGSCELKQHELVMECLDRRQEWWESIISFSHSVRETTRHSRGAIFNISVLEAGLGMVLEGLLFLW